MVNKPPLPEGFGLPAEVNGWVHTPKSNKNGHVWISESAQRSVGVFSGITDRVRVAVFDDRVDGFCSKIQPVERSLEDGETQAEATAWGVERAVAWMERQIPERWDHPHVEEAVFDPPVGFVLDRYYLEEREHTVCYRQGDTEKAVSMVGGRPPETEPSLETRAYLYVEVWRGSGNATIALAPWLRAHDHEKHEIANPPEECGLAVALKLAREWVQEEAGQTRDSPAIGQSDLGAWSG
ncbi:hypothetical protein [Halococcus thailandensis]|jgi:hypothetical protein|uniref:Uncharacterized protein n=1 Tax=Halococcus thailandensis JCM 13552 TaxID=1227457 RepID=M0NGF4_9EURY|nr:hypothetical protein [Halococcus thailandensis]EMA56628.1 hypothetical protein C451_01348 [Halococcus thailandensis JCM 13552]